MRIERSDVLLAVGLSFAVVLAFFDDLVRLVGLGGLLADTLPLGRLPGLAVMVAVLLVHVQSKRRELAAQTATIEAHARESQERAHDLERLVVLWKGLTQSLDLDTVRDTVALHVPGLTRSAEAWLVTGEAGAWTGMFGPTALRTSRGETDTCEFALEAVAFPGAGARPEGIEHEGQICFPLVAAGATLGALGVPAGDESMTVARRQVIGAAAALIAVSVRSANLLREVRENTLRDSLTGCATRAHGLDAAVSDLKRARRSRLPVSMLMIDLDHFKRINDLHGHLCGDAVLAAVGARIRSTLRESDLKCRYGGDEFLAVLPDTPLEGAARAAETLRRSIADLEIHWQGQTIRVTSSVGVGGAHRDELDPTLIIARADAALYRAKRDGRNCVRVEDDAPAATADSR